MAGGVRQTQRDSIDRGLFTERSSEQDQLNIYYGRSIAAGELSNGLDISLAPAGGRHSATYDFGPATSLAQASGCRNGVILLRKGPIDPAREPRLGREVGKWLQQALEFKGGGEKKDCKCEPEHSEER